MLWLKRLRERLLVAPQRAVVSFDDEAVVCRRSNGMVETILWSDLQTVLIQTTDQGPFVDDVFWVLAGIESGCVVPSESEGMENLLERLQDLPNFDHQTVIKAMGCTENQEFVCWRRDATSDIDTP
jgi:hypothetical protein